MSMQSHMAADLSALFTRDMPAQAKIGAKTFSVLIDDLLSEEIEAYGGPESISIQRIHFLASEKSSIEIGLKMAIRQKDCERWESKFVMSSVLSADGNELIVTVKSNCK